MPKKCPYKAECATTIYHGDGMMSFIRGVCDTDAHIECLHFGGLDAQHKERERLYGDPHAHEPDWDEVARAAVDSFRPNLSKLVGKRLEELISEVDGVLAFWKSNLLSLVAEKEKLGLTWDEYREREGTLLWEQREYFASELKKV